MKRLFYLFAGISLLATTSLLVVSCNDDDDDNTPEVVNIVETAQNTPELSTLVDALVRAGLDDDLASQGPFTVFAPTNQAFADFLSDNGFNSLDDVPVDVLTDVLLNHVLGGIEVEAGDIDANGVYASTLLPTEFNAGAFVSLYARLDNGDVVINGGPSVSTADVEATNGIIHIVNGVINIPTVVDFATSSPGLTSLVAALTRSDLPTDFVSVLSGDGPFTVFAPTDQAFQDLIDGNPDWNDLNDIDSATLDAVLKYHVSDEGNFRSTDLTDDLSVNTLLMNASFTIDLTDPNQPAIDDGAGRNTDIIFTDVQAANGVVHLVDAVLLPSS